MKKSAPKSVAVEPEGYQRGQGIPIYTKLFREYANLPEALEAVYERHEPGEDLAMLSVASSIGAEVDSLLALHNVAQRSGRIAIRGIDINQSAIDVAKEGRYVTDRLHGREDKAVREMLQEYEFGIDHTETTGETHIVNRHWLNAERVRVGHDVQFDLQDAVNDGGLEGAKADLITANNILFHLSPENASRMMMNMAEALAPRGVLSVGDNPRQITMDGNAADGKPYDQWLGETGEIIQKYYGVQPIAYGEQDAPVMFARD